MRKILIFIAIFIFFISSAKSNAVENIDKSINGRWAEKISERVVMDIYSDKNNKEYQIYITWREDGLAQKDVYRFKAVADKNGVLKYKNGVHIYRYYDSKNNFEDKIDYSDGSGKFIIGNGEITWIDDKNNTENTIFIPANKDLTKDTTIKTKLFSITLPEEVRGIYETKKEKDKISIYHKDSKAAGFGGFAFGIKAYKNPQEHANLPGGGKIGELTDKKDVLYDMVLKYPTDVQYDYTKNPPDLYKILYNIGNVINIEGTNGSTYFKNQGTRGIELYKDVLQKHIKAIDEKWDSNKLEKENMSYMYNVIAQTGGNVLNKIGYTYYDLNGDGIEELLIGEITKGKLKGVIYDIYTMVNRTPRHVASGGTRDRYFACDYSFVCNEYSSGALESGMRVYNLTENSTELYPQVFFKYDGYTNAKKPWFISYSNDEWDNVTEKYYIERKKVFDKYERFNYTPLSKLKNTAVLYDRYNPKKEYFDYSVVLEEFPKDYYYTTVKINKSKNRILIITDNVNNFNNSYHGLFYYFAKNEFVYPLGYLESKKPFLQSDNYLYLNDGNKDVKFYMSDKKLEIIKSKINKIKDKTTDIKFEKIKTAEKFLGDFGSPAGNDIKKVTIDGLYFEYHKPQYKREYIKNLVQECINDGVKTQVQMYSCVVNKLHPKNANTK